MKVIPHLFFRGNCAEAFQVYADWLRGSVIMSKTYGESPGPVAPEMRDQIVHATLKIGADTLTGVDVSPEQYRPPQGFAIQLNIETADEAQRIFRTFAEGGTVHLQLQRTFWSEQYGVLTDRFGTPWEINCTGEA